MPSWWIDGRYLYTTVSTARPEWIVSSATMMATFLANLPWAELRRFSAEPAQPPT